MMSTNRKLSLANLLRMMLHTAGEHTDMMKKSLCLGIITAALRGMAFITFIPLFVAIQTKNWQKIVSLLMVMSLFLLLSSLSDWFSRNYDYHGYSAKAGDQLRRQLGKKLRRLPLQTLYRQRTGELNASISNSVDDVINYSMTVALMLINAVLTPIVVGFGVCWWDWRLGIALLLLFPSVLPIYWWIRPKLNRHKIALSDANAFLSAETLEYTQGLSVLKSTHCVGAKTLRFNDATIAVKQAQIADMVSTAPVNILLGSIIEIGMMLIVGLGLWLVSHNDISLIVLAGLMVAVIRFGEPLSTFISMISVFELVNAGYQRLSKILAIEPLPQGHPIDLPKHFDLTYEDVSFSYENSEKNALSKINLYIPANALTALVGSSGCGKTTLVKLLMRYADPQMGTVRIGGIDIRQIEHEALNQLIAVVFQDVYLFDDSILANIRMGRASATDEEIIKACKAAHFHEFIQQLPNGYHTSVGEIGGHLSGGEKQRLSIARALLKDAPIIILDEPTASLDTQSELAVQSAIDALVQNKTVIVIAHRLSTIVAANQIIVLDEGQLVEQGNHPNLLSKNGRYAQLWFAQNSH